MQACYFDVIQHLTWAVLTPYSLSLVTYLIPLVILPVKLETLPYLWFCKERKRKKNLFCGSCLEKGQIKLLENGEVSILWRLLERINSKLLELGKMTVLSCPFRGVSFLVNQYLAETSLYLVDYYISWQVVRHQTTNTTYKNKKKRMIHGHVWELVTDDLKISHGVGRFWGDVALGWTNWNNYNLECTRWVLHFVSPLTGLFTKSDLKWTCLYFSLSGVARGLKGKWACYWSVTMDQLTVLR